MKIVIDTVLQTLCCQNGEQVQEVPLYSPEAFQRLSQWWVKVGWNEKYAYTFTWLGRPIIQLPEDMIRVQEVIYELKPDVIIETGVAHGGSAVFYAGLCKLMGKGRVIGVDISIRPHNRTAIQQHELAGYITLVEGNSTAPEVVGAVGAGLQTGEKVMVILDSCHAKAHVLAELEAYAPLVSPGSYLVITDGLVQDLADVPRGQEQWQWDNPRSAVAEFLPRHPEFIMLQPARKFRESPLQENVTYWPGAWLQKTDINAAGRCK